MFKQQAMKFKKAALLVSIIVVFVTVSFILVSFNVKSRVKELFKLNKELQEEGYYMAEFEFRMLGFSYYLDKGYFIKAHRMLSDFHKKLKDKNELIKIPEFTNNQDEIDFYLNLQNPVTGAFIDETAPYCVYYEISQNIINHIEALSDSSTHVQLKYPLKFLDEINTPESLTNFLDDISYVGWIASKFPQTTFHFARNILDATRPDCSLEKNNLYHFSPEWKHAMLTWMYNFQDSTTGLWGPKNRKTKKLVKPDINNTSSIVKSFRDKEGNNIHAEYPLKHADKIFTSTLEYLSEPFPDDDDLDKIHEWNLGHVKGMKMLLRYLWKDASVENRNKARVLMEKFVNISFEKYYVEKDGAFSYYPNAEYASVDGMTNLILDDVGALSYIKQKKLWGEPFDNLSDLGIINVNYITNSDLERIKIQPDINSIRIYASLPDFENLSENVWAVYYPHATKVLDITELVPNIINWTESSSISMGNWNSMAEIKNQYSSLNKNKPLIFHEEVDLNVLYKKMKESPEICFVGFDILQIPVFMMTFRH